MFQLPQRLSLTFTSSEGPFIELFSPNDGKVLSSVQQAMAADIDLILKTTQEAQKEMEALRPFERSRILLEVARELKGQVDFLAQVIASEGGKPLKDAKVEVQRAIATIELCAEETLRLTGEVIPMERTPAGKDHLAFTMKSPIGAVLAISAFNHPLNLIAHQVGCAIASGNSVVLKPASSTPLSAYFLWEAFQKAQLPKNGLRVVNAPTELVEKLVASSEFHFVTFIGSAKVGWEMRRKIAPGTRISLEHGGQAAAIVREDADLEQAVTALIKGAFYHAGQVCISTQKIFVQEKVFETFLKEFSLKTQKLKVGPATQEDTDVGPLIRAGEVVRIQEWIQEALTSGAKLEMGNKTSGNAHQYLSPTILSQVPREARLMKDEVFGPVVCINSYQEEEELLDYLNSNSYVFESALFTKDLSRALQIASSITTMTFVINNHTAFRVDQMPFGGHGQSGLGIGGVKYAMEEMTRMKQVIIKI
ncbi:MAG: aldehyde dehydrogenase family protein [Bacteriovoracaceae bacterium]|nr:aldehyde dehydrogenase family protein [Bacteriovoracaceae bacterium]